MIKVYANLIREGVKTIDEVPAKLRDKVKELLISLDLDHLVK